MDIESQKTLDEAIDRIHSAGKDLLNSLAAQLDRLNGATITITIKLASNVNQQADTPHS